MGVDVLKAALQYRDVGLAVHWLRPRSKVPISAGWSKAPILTAQELRDSYQRGLNVGFRAGTPSTVGGKPICVLDIDVRGGPKYQKEALAAAEAVYGAPIEYDVVSGSQVGRHKILAFPIGRAPEKAATTLVQSLEYVSPEGVVCAARLKGAKPAWVVELLSTGKNVVLPPSIHPDTGLPYSPLRDLLKFDDAPAALLNYIDSKNAAPDWGVPEALGQELEPVLPITEDMLPEPIREWCVDIAYRMQCPLEFTAVGAIAMFGSIIGAGCAIRPKQKDNWSEVPNLWGAIVAGPGRLKTPALNQVFGPLRGLEHIAEREHQQNMLAFHEREALLKMEVDLAKSKVKNASPSMSDADRSKLTSEAARLVGRREEEPTPRRYIMNDSTPEKLGECIDNNPRGLLVMRDELMGLLESFEKQGHEGEKEFYLEAWGGMSSHRVDRIGRGSLHIDPLCASVFGGIQPQKVEAYVWKMQAEGNNGFIQRYQLLAYPDDKASSKYVDETPNCAARDQVMRLAERLAYCDATSLGAQKDGVSEIPFFRFDPKGAQPLFVKWLIANDLRVAAEEMPLMSEHLSKYRKLVPALTLIFYLISVAANPPPPPTKPTKSTRQRRPACIGKEHIALALRWAVVLETHARRVYRMGTDYRVAAAKCLAKKIEAGQLGDGFSARDVYRNGWTNLSDADLVKEACDELEAAQWLRRIDQSAGGQGRPRDPCYEINPAVLLNAPLAPTKPPKRRRS
ncbi:MAG: DUF3987 domain-containing protein [Burkholderiales bacterium]|nr:DUF3987 domain-containing protein [Burkholderiales bacterium]